MVFLGEVFGSRRSPLEYLSLYGLLPYGSVWRLIIYKKRKVWILDWSYMCKSNGELVDHLFLHCPVAMDLWSMVLGLFGVTWVMPHTVLGLLGCWQGSFGRHRNGYIWSIVPHCLMWCLWRERNSRCFEDIERSSLDLKLRTLLDWSFALQKQSFPSFIDLLDSCNFCIWFVDPLYTPCVLGCLLFDINKTCYL